MYSEPLIYDILHAEETARDARVVAKLVRKALPSAPERLRLLEPACGTGRYLLALAKHGHHATGIDLSQTMVDFSNQRAAHLGLQSRAITRRADMTAFAPIRPRCHAAFNLINSIRHLGSDKAMLAHFDCIRRSLVPGGVYIVGIELILPELMSSTEDVWTGRRGSTAVHQLVSFLPEHEHTKGPRRELVISTITVTNTARRKAAPAKPTSTKPALTKPTPTKPARSPIPHSPTEPRVIESSYTLRTYTPDQWATLLDRAGWQSIAEHTISGARWPYDRKLGYRLVTLRPH